MMTIRSASSALLFGCLILARAAWATDIYFVDLFNPDPSYGSIRLTTDAGTPPSTLVDTGGGLRAIDLDRTAGKMYWCDVNNFVIRRANLDGTNQQDLVTSGLQFPSAIAVHPGIGKMYWGDQVSNELWRANLDGSNPELLLSTAFHRGIAIDAENGKVYWSTSISAWRGDILRANLDGSNQETIITTEILPEFKPSAIALDIEGGKIYWTDYVVDVVQRANLNGTNVQTLYVVGANHNPRGIALDLDAGKVYWGQDLSFKGLEGAIMRMNLDGSMPQMVLRGVGKVNYLALHPGNECFSDVVPPVGDGVVDVNDLLAIIGAWGSNDPQFDIAPPPSGDGIVDVNDLLAIIGAWGPCQ